MKHCPKCQRFYDDEFLQFCLSDGMPLTEIKEESKLWNDGKKQIELEKKVVKRQIKKERLRKIILILTTICLMILVVSVITLNAWIYLSKPDKELVKDTKPKPTQEKIIIPEIGFDSTPTPTKTPTPKPTATVIATKTPTPSPTPMISPPPDLCPKSKQIEAEKRIETQYAKTWREQFLKDKDRALQYSKPKILQLCQAKNPAINCEVVLQRTEFDLSKTPTGKPKADKLCKNVSVNVTFIWKVTLPNNYGSFSFPQTKPFNYPFK